MKEIILSAVLSSHFEIPFSALHAYVRHRELISFTVFLSVFLFPVLFFFCIM